MARSATRPKSTAKGAPKGAPGGGARGAPKAARAIRPVALAAGLGLYWLVEYQDAGNAADAPIWGYVTMQGVRVLVDFVGAWFVVSALQLVIAAGGFGVTYLRTLLAPQSR
jgi:hypothetical protein